MRRRPKGRTVTCATLGLPTLFLGPTPTELLELLAYYDKTYSYRLEGRKGITVPANDMDAAANTALVLEAIAREAAN